MIEFKCHEDPQSHHQAGGVAYILKMERITTSILTSICSGHQAFQVSSSLSDKINSVNHICDRRLSEESYKFLMKRMELKADEFPI